MSTNHSTVSQFPPQDGPCDFNRAHNIAGCGNLDSGHTMHFIQAKHAGNRGWIWRDGIITEVEGQFGRVKYLDGSAHPRIWYHLPLDDLLEIGEPVRMTENIRGVIQTGNRMFSVAIAQGAGEIPDPTDPDEIAYWERNTTPVITNLATGESISLGHGEDARNQQHGTDNV